MMNKETRKNDPIIPNPEKMEGTEMSPMDPPEALEPPAMDSVDYENMNPFLKELVDDHQKIIPQLEAFEKALIAIPEQGITKEIKETIRDFFEFFDYEFIPHNRREESELFPQLQEKLLEIGEHSIDKSKTPVDILLADHIEALQLAAVTFNLFSLVTKINDLDSKLVIVDLAINQGKALVELIRVHIFREDNIVFSLAQKLLPETAFENMKKHEHCACEH